MLHELLSALWWVPLAVMLSAWAGVHLHRPARRTRRVGELARWDRPGGDT